MISVDGVEVEGRQHLIDQLQEDGPRKTIRLKRGEEVIECVFDYSDDPEEQARAAWREAEEQRKAKRARGTGMRP